jgi:hypothetical protein
MKDMLFNLRLACSNHAALNGNLFRRNVRPRLEEIPENEEPQVLAEPTLEQNDAAAPEEMSAFAEEPAVIQADDSAILDQMPADFGDIGGLDFEPSFSVEMNEPRTTPSTFHCSL